MNGILNWLSKNQSFLLLLCLGVLFIYTLEQQKNNASLEVLNKVLEKEKQRNKQQLDSLQINLSHLEQDLEVLKKQPLKYKKQIKHINKQSNARKEYISNLRDVDSLTVILTRRYN
jgi:septal ring factor EnvC (AmiA/AmiB activator)